MKKYIAVLIALLVFISSFVSCGLSDVSISGTEGDNSTTEAIISSDVPENPTESPAITSQPEQTTAEPSVTPSTPEQTTAEPSVTTNAPDQTSAQTESSQTAPVTTAHNHSFGAEWKTDAYNHWHTCSCGEKSQTAAHSFGEWVTTKTATEQAAGAEHRVCSVCGYKEEKNIPALGHTHKFGTEWQSDDAKHWHVCECGEKNGIANHTLSEWIVDVEPTCTLVGIRHQACTICGKTIREDTIAERHTPGEWITDKKATCTENGSKHQVCSVCNATIKTEVIPATGHSLKTTVQKKTCIHAAGVTKKCTVCLYTTTEKIQPMNLTATKTGQSAATFNGYGSFSKQYTITVTGGYGSKQYQYDLFSTNTATTPTLSAEYSTETKFGFSYTGYDTTSDAYVLQVTVKDEADQMQIFRISLKDLTVTKTIDDNAKGKCAHLVLLDTADFLAKYGFAKYKCSDCGREAYLDKNGKELILAELELSKDKTKLLGVSNIDTAELLIVPDTICEISADAQIAYKKNLKYVLCSNTILNHNNFLSLLGCSLDSVWVPANCSISLWEAEIKTLVWEDGVDKVDNFNIYSGCKGRSCQEATIQNIVIPESLSLIKGKVFLSAKITNVFYKGTPAQWDEIEMEDGNRALQVANRYYYSETKPTTAGNYWHYVNWVPTVW